MANQTTTYSYDNKPRVALVCDWLTEIGGAEQVLLELSNIFPKAPIYTSQYRPSSAPWFKRKDVRTGWLNIAPRRLRKFIAPLRIIYFNHLKLDGYDIVISVCNAECKAIKTNPGTLHIAYLQGPPTQYYWGLYDQYIENPGFGRLNWLARLGLKLFVKPMRRLDYRAAHQPDFLVANSHYVLDEINKYYQRDGEILFPPADITAIKIAIRQLNVGQVNRLRQELFNGADFFVIAGRQVNWKRFDLAISACLQTKKNLLVVGDGPEHEALVKMTNGQSNIKFLPRYNGPADIVRYFRAAQGLIFPSLEPFGIVPVEALACGLPILAYAKGGAADIVIEGLNGHFFSQQTVTSLIEGIDKFNVVKYKKTVVARTADRFNQLRFEQRVKQLIQQYCKGSSDV